MPLHDRHDPGPCPVDDAPHTTCVAPNPGAIVIVQLPARDGFTEPPLVGEAVAPALVGAVPPLLAEEIQKTLPPGEFTSGTYRRKGRR